MSQRLKGGKRLSALTIKKFAKALDLPDTVTGPLLGNTPESSPSEQLDDIGALTRDQLELLAGRFEIDKSHAIGDAELQKLLTQKAEEYRTLVLEVESFRGLTGRIDNIYAAAVDAVKQLDLDEAKALVESAREIQEQEVLRPALDSNAKPLETSAEIELLRGNADAAYSLFCMAADGFRSLDVRDCARRRDRYRSQLYRHGLPYSRTGLACAIEISRPGIASLETVEHGMD